MRLALYFLLALVFLTLNLGVSQAQGEITVISSTTENKFPEGILFTLEASSDGEVDQVILVYRTAGSKVNRYAYPDFEPGKSIKAQFLLKTSGSSATHIPPGTDITYFYRLEDKKGNTLETEPKVITHMDNRFEWEALEKGLVSVFYYGPIKSRAQTVLDVTTQTINNMSKILGVEVTEPTRVILYNTTKDMVAALPFVSKTTRSGLITQGQAWSEQRVMLVLSIDPLVKGIASHEITHILVHQATESAYGFIPSWLNEGLAEYANIDPGYSYDAALAYAIAEGRILSITSMTTQPGDPDDVILFYGQSRSIVKFMIEEYGVVKIQELLKAFKGSGDIDKALQEVYGFDRVGLDNRWRASLGLKPLSPEELPKETLTPEAIPTMVPFGAKPTPTFAPSPTPEATVALTPTPTAKRGGLACGSSSVPPSENASRPSALDLALLGAVVGPGVLFTLKRFIRRRNRLSNNQVAKSTLHRLSGL